MQSLPRNPTARSSMGGGNIGDNKESIFCRGGGSKIKDHNLQKLFALYSAGIFNLKCKMAFHLECTNCKLHKECLTSVQRELTLVYQTAFNFQLLRTRTLMEYRNMVCPTVFHWHLESICQMMTQKKVTIVILSIAISCSHHPTRMNQHQ
jgi:hypothetical protein